jgi:hypothetical protein
LSAANLPALPIQERRHETPPKEARGLPHPHSADFPPNTPMSCGDGHDQGDAWVRDAGRNLPVTHETPGDPLSSAEATRPAGDQGCGEVGGEGI